MANTKPSPDTSELRTCRACKTKFTNRANRRGHEASVHSLHGGVQVIKCQFCNMSFKRKGDYDRYIEWIHESFLEAQGEISTKKSAEVKTESAKILDNYKIPKIKKPAPTCTVSVCPGTPLLDERTENFAAESPPAPQRTTAPFR